MKRFSHFWCSLYFLLVFTTGYGQQQELLIIGRTTGELSLDGEKVRVFGFTNTLSGQVTLPGTTIDVRTGDSIVLDFWNISQGNPHVIFMDSISLQRRTKEGVLAEEQAVYHMDHGYYHFTAPAPGTYLYYCSENFPLHFRAGMFGVMIVRPEMPAQPVRQELLWCSFELDLAWQEFALLETEYATEPDELPAYDPEYFLLNGKPIREVEPLLSNAGESTEPVLLRLVNAGQWQHEISFPEEVKVQPVSAGKALQRTKRYQQLVLNPRETFELLIYPLKGNKQCWVKYVFRDPVSERTKHRAFLSLY